MRQPKFRVARGAEEVRTLVSSLYESPSLPKCVYGISDMDVLERHFPEYSFSSGNPSRLRAGVPSKFLYTSSQGPVYTSSDHLLMRTSRYLPYKYLKPYLDVTIIGDCVMFLTEKDGTIVAEATTDHELASKMRSIFDRLWLKAE